MSTRFPLVKGVRLRATRLDNTGRPWLYHPKNLRIGVGRRRLWKQYVERKIEAIELQQEYYQETGHYPLGTTVVSGWVSLGL